MNYNVKNHNIALANIHIYFNIANIFFKKQISARIRLRNDLRGVKSLASGKARQRSENSALRADAVGIKRNPSFRALCDIVN